MQAPDIALLAEGREERFEVDDSSFELLAKEDGPRRFKCVAYTGKDVQRSYGRMVVDLEGMRFTKRMGMLVEHDDMAGVAVCDRHKIVDGVLYLEGYFLDDVASEGRAKALIAKADQGWPLKMSIGVRFRKHSYVEDGEKFECNGRKLKGPMVRVDECDLFETSFIHVNPADLDTEASVMRAKAQEQRMAEANKAPEMEVVGKTTEQLVAEVETRVRAQIKAEQDYEAALVQAFPEETERAKAREAKLSLSDVLRQGLEKHANRVKVLEQAEKDKESALKAIAQRASQAGSPGVDVKEAKTVSTPEILAITGPYARRVEAELKQRPHLYEVFKDDTHKVVEAWVRSRGKVATREGKPVLIDLHNRDVKCSATTLASLEKMASDVESGFRAERLDVGSSAPDLSRATVNGFQGSFYNSYEEELSKNWSAELSYQIASDQQAEIVRWLGAPPMIQEWKGPRIAKNIPIYEQLLKAVKFEGTLDVSRFDWDHQKWDLISKSFGLFGAVASQHWDIRFTQLLESNPTAYDGFSLFSDSHTLGGDSGTIVNDWSKDGAANTGTASKLAVNNPEMPTQLEWADIILQLTPKFRSFAWANGIKMHGTARQWAIMCHPDFEGNLQAVMSSERLDLGASNPLYGQRSQYKVIPNAYLTTHQYIYIFRVDTQNKALLRTEPDPLEMMWQGPGSHLAFTEDKYAMGLRCVRAIAPGAFESVLRAKVG